jgi:hypothetical protein
VALEFPRFTERDATGWKPSPQGFQWKTLFSTRLRLDALRYFEGGFVVNARSLAAVVALVVGRRFTLAFRQAKYKMPLLAIPK